MKTLVIGYGNPYRGDDGVAFHLLRDLAEHLGRRPLELDEDGLDDLGYGVDLVCLRQLVPELAETLVDYDRVLFVDAHTGAFPESVRFVELEPRYAVAAFTHHMSPEMLLAIAQAFSCDLPEARLISVRGYDFDLGTALSPEARANADRAVEYIMDLLASERDDGSTAADSPAD